MTTATQTATPKAKLPRGTRARLAQIRKWITAARDVSVYGTEFGFQRVHKYTARKLLKKHAGEIVGRYCDVFDVLTLERSPF